MKPCRAGLVLAFLSFGAQSAMAASLSFTGNFTHDNDVQLFNFSLAATSDVIINTLSFAGGTNFAGATISSGGFTPYLALFDSNGDMLTQVIGKNACGGGNPAAPDPSSGACWDEYFIYDLSHFGQLAAGSYTLALTEWDNVANALNLADGFLYDGGPVDFTGGPFLDSLAGQRDGHWAVDISFAGNTPPVGIPEPAILMLLLAGVTSARFSRRQASY